MTSRKTIRRIFIVPIYDAEVRLIVAEDIGKERKRLSKYFGDVLDGSEYDAMCSWSGGHRFALFLSYRALTAKVISHEIFHLTHRMMDWVGANFDRDHHEQGALLHGYLTEKVAKLLNKAEATAKKKD